MPCAPRSPTGWNAATVCRLNPATQVLPVNGSREALFALAQTVVDPTRQQPLVMCPNPFYQIYEGAACWPARSPTLSIAIRPATSLPTLPACTHEVWSRMQLVYVCSPGNPTGAVLPLDEWRELFELSDRYGFVIAATSATPRSTSRRKRRSARWKRHTSSAAPIIRA